MTGFIARRLVQAIVVVLLVTVIVFILLHLHAYRKRSVLGLNELELFDTRDSIQESALNCGVALVSLLIVIVGGAARSSLAGMAYLLMPVVMTLNGTLMGKRRRRLERLEQD